MLEFSNPKIYPREERRKEHVNSAITIPSKNREFERNY
jgi:hypothetical protein